MKRFVMAVVLCLSCAAAADLAPGDKLPDCGKVPLISVHGEYRTQRGAGSSIEDLILPDGVLIVHFAMPRPRAGAAFPPILQAEIAAVAKATRLTEYRCQGAVILPFGAKGRDDYLALRQNEAAEDGRWVDGLPVYWEPTWPHPGLYETFRPGAAIETPYTVLIGPDRTILAVRRVGEGDGLFEWLRANLPATLPSVALPPSADIDLPPANPDIWPAFRRTIRREAAAETVADRLPYYYLAWRARVGRTFASPVVVDDTAYVSVEGGGLSAVSLRDGDIRADGAPGGAWWSTPVVSGDQIVTIDEGGVVTALDRVTLEQVWATDLDSLVTSSPALADGRLIVGTRRGTVEAIDAASGRRLWSYQTGGEVSSSPALADGLVLIGSGDRKLYALNIADGTVRWTLATGGPVDSSPLVAGDVVLVGSFDGRLYAADLRDGTARWTCELGGWVHSSPAVAGDMVYVGTVPVTANQQARFCWVDLGTGALRGSYQMPDAVYSSPTVWGELVFVGCRDYNVYAFSADMAPAQPVWSYHTRSYVHASPVVVGDTLLIAGYDGTLHALRQEKPISTWQPDDVVPRWFMAALARELHRGTESLLVAVARGNPPAEATLPHFDELFARLRDEAGQPPAAGRVLPRDVPSEHPGAPFIEYALTAGLLAGYPDGTFEPSTPTTRYQFSSGLGAVLSMVTRPDFAWRALKEAGVGDALAEASIEPSRDRPPRSPSDVDGPHWAYGQLEELGRVGLLPLDDENRFRGDRVVTLADAAVQWNLIADGLRARKTR